MKKLMAALVVLVFGLINICWAVWDGWVKDKYGSLLPGVQVFASYEEGADPYAYTNNYGIYLLNTSKGMQDGEYYEMVYITYGIGGSTQGGTYYESQHIEINIQEGQYYQDTK